MIQLFGATSSWSVARSPFAGITPGIPPPGHRAIEQELAQLIQELELLEQRKVLIEQRVALFQQRRALLEQELVVVSRQLNATAAETPVRVT